MADGARAFPGRSDRHRNRHFFSHGETVPDTTQHGQQVYHGFPVHRCGRFSAGIFFFRFLYATDFPGLDDRNPDGGFRVSLRLRRYSDSSAGGINRGIRSTAFFLTGPSTGGSRVTLCRRVAQGESASLTRKRSLVQIQSRLPKKLRLSRKNRESRSFFYSIEGRNFQDLP